MIVPDEVAPHELIRVLTSYDDVEEEMLAKVLANEGTHLLVTYLSPTSMVYKSAGVHSFDAKAERVDFESITEHHPGVIDITDLGMMNVGKNMFVMKNEVDEDETDSEIEDMSDDEYEDDGFIEFDESATPMELPPDSAQVDEEWNKWQPRSRGASRFKETIDSLEMMARHHMDEQGF